MQKVTDNIFLLVLFAMLGTFILAASFIFFFIRYQRKITQQKEAMQKAELEYNEQLLHATLLSQEEERKRIGRDLHDDVGASLSNLKMIMAQTVEVTPDKPSYKPLIDNIITTVRNISHSLSPPGLSLFGLESTLHELFDNFNLAGNIKLAFENDLGERLNAFHEQTALALYRVIQELLTNTVKHAHASEVLIRCFEESGSTIITYQDDGKGMDAVAGKKHGMGMQNIEARLRMIQAHYELPVVDQGFFIKIIIPA
ncbi:MAG: sensor histidine kinase [Ferruginibacter sp.]